MDPDLALTALAAAQPTMASVESGGLKALFVATALAVPLIAQGLARRSRLIDALGPVLICYLVGIALANLGFPVPDQLAQDVTGGAVVLAIPLLVLSTDFVAWVRTGGKAVLSFALAVVAVSTAAAVATRAFAGDIPDAHKVAGMLVGVYTGGTANLASIGRALGVSDETYFLLNASDVILSGAYLLFLLTLAKPLLSRVLPPTPRGEGEDVGSPAAPAGAGAGGLPRGMAQSFIVSAACGGLSVGASLAITGEMTDVIIIVGITSLGIAASLIPRIRALPGSYELGNYFILVFCVAIGALTDFSALMASGQALFLFTAAVLSSAILLHYALAALLKIDVDTAIITSTAAVFGPPFVAMIADALGNRGVLLSGLTTGLVGYAVGNYLGLLVAWALGP